MAKCLPGSEWILSVSRPFTNALHLLQQHLSWGWHLGCGDSCLSLLSLPCSVNPYSTVTMAARAEKLGRWKVGERYINLTCTRLNEVVTVAVGVVVFVSSSSLSTPTAHNNN
ncbi:hypothetical protein H1C71_040677 [Ictidomys tridecemlineatus]|nr:hypothetical protein H1C71_040677 [Ictidomys tridecemlineatus]